MKIAMIGLGKMGLNMANRLCRSGISVVGFDIAKIPTEQLKSDNFLLASTLKNAVNSLSSPKIIWLMLPSGTETQNVFDEILPILNIGDIVVDGSNSNYKDTIKRGKKLNELGHQLIDVGVSGGIWGLNDGYCLMVGGESSAVSRLMPLLNVLAHNGSEGWKHIGTLGAGHYAKMIHNGIEYGMMQALAEGLELANSNSQFSIDTSKLTELWRNGSVIRSWLLDMLCLGFNSNPNLAEISPIVHDSGEGRWFAIEAIEQGIPTPVITQALNMRFQSQRENSYSFKVLSIMRNAFGGHKIPRN